MNKKTVYVLGNPMEKSDSPAVKLIPLLKEKFPSIDFIRFDPTEELPQNISDNFIMLDTVIGISKVTKFNDLNFFKLSPRVTAHDFDLPLHLGILKKLGKINNITIIGIPSKKDIDKSFKEVVTILTTSGI